MKKTTLLLLAMLTTVATLFAQRDSTVTLTLPAYQHGHIVAFMPSKSDADDIKYLNQVAKQLVLDTLPGGKVVVKDSTQAIRVVVNFDQVKRYFLAIGSNQERLVGFNNTLIKKSLADQLMASGKYTLLTDIDKQVKQSGSETDQLIHLAFEYLITIKQ